MVAQKVGDSVFCTRTVNAIRSRWIFRHGRKIGELWSTARRRVDRRVVAPIIVAGNKRNESSTSTGATNASMYFHYSPVYSQFILYLYLIYVSIVIIYAEINVTFTHSGTIVVSFFPHSPTRSKLSIFSTSLPARLRRPTHGQIIVQIRYRRFHEYRYSAYLLVRTTADLSINVLEFCEREMSRRIDILEKYAPRVGHYPALNANAKRVRFSWRMSRNYRTSERVSN